MTPSIFEDIRRACARVAGEAEHVQLLEDALDDYARSLAVSGLEPPVYDRSHHFWGEPEATLAYLVTLDAVNFGSGYFPQLLKRPGMSGYFTVASSLKDHFERHGPLSAQALSRMTPQACAALFGQPTSGPTPADALRAELMMLFAQALRNLGEFLLARFEGSFVRLIQASERSAARLVTLLSAMPLYRDEATYHGFRVPLYKRAQITASDLALAFDGQGYGRFDDLAELTIFADNLVPHVLHVDGVLRYSPALAGKVEHGELLEPGSVMEVELRAVAVHAVECLRERLELKLPDLTSQQLDILLWNRGQRPEYRRRPRHRSRTVFY